jgi:hypothetical protein
VEPVEHLKTRKREYLKGKINDLEKIKTKILEICTEA